MLPVATPPNVIVFGSGYTSLQQMMRAGLLLNVVAAVLLTLLCRFVIVPFLLWGYCLRLLTRFLHDRGPAAPWPPVSSGWRRVPKGSAPRRTPEGR